MKSFFFVSLFILFFGIMGYAQEVTTEDHKSSDTTVIPPPSYTEVSVIDSLSFPNIPRKAFLFSSVFPGLGQALNKKYWKIPIVYGGFIFLSWQIDRYNSTYINMKQQLFQLKKDPNTPLPSGLTEERLRNLIDKYRRERDYMIVWTAGLYVLQIVDAHIDAHLKDFDLNPTLQVKIGTSLEPLMATGMAGGLGIKLIF